MASNEMPMVWNEPGEQGGKDKKPNPWGSKPEQGGPPDLEKLFAKFFQGLKGMGNFSGKSGQGNGTSNNTVNIGLIIGLAIILYLASGIYIVEQAERAVVTCFGKYEGISDPGLHWLLPFIEDSELVNVGQVSSTKHSGLMLTQDENIVSVEVVVQYKVKNAKDYLYNVLDPSDSLRQAAESALRQVIGHSKLDDVLTSGRAKIGNDIKTLLQQTLDSYGAGLEVSDIAMQPAKPPEEVKGAFDDVIKAREEQVSLVNAAEAYINEIIPKAEGQVKRIIEDSIAYREETSLSAEGNTARFNLILPEFKKAPLITQTRLYLDALQQVFSRSTKILIDVNQSNNLIYLPLDKLMKTDEKGSDGGSPSTVDTQTINIEDHHQSKTGGK